MYLIVNCSKYLAQIVDSIFVSLNYNKIECNVVSDIDFKDEKNIYIILNINNLTLVPKRFFVYNFEQLTTEKIWDDTFFEKCKLAEKILDYSLENIKVFYSKDLAAFHVPFGWTPILESTVLTDSNMKVIDLMFLGSINKRRKRLLNRYNAYYKDKVFTESYDELVRKSKFSMNIHYYEGGSILEVTRIIPLICNNVQVISERSNDKYYDDIFDDIITFVDFENEDEVNEQLLNYNFEKCITSKKKLIDRLNYMEIIKNNLNLF